MNGTLSFTADCLFSEKLSTVKDDQSEQTSKPYSGVWSQPDGLWDLSYVGHDISYTYRMVSRVFRIPFRGDVASEKCILNMSDIILHVFCIMAANQLCVF